MAMMGGVGGYKADPESAVGRKARRYETGTTKAAVDQVRDEAATFWGCGCGCGCGGDDKAMDRDKERTGRDREERKKNQEAESIEEDQQKENGVSVLIVVL